MTKLCARGKAAAKRKFAIYPSAYANAYASKICAGKIKDPSGKKRKDWGPKKASKGLAITAGAESGLGRIQKSGLSLPKKARAGKLIEVGKQLLQKKFKKKPGGQPGPNKATSKVPITKDVNVNKKGQSSLSGTEMQVKDKKAKFVLDRHYGQDIKSIPTIKGKPKYKKGGLTKWFKEKWVDISSKKPGGGYRECGRKSASQSKRGYPKCVPAAKAASMTKGQIRSAVARKRKVSNVGPKPTNVKTIIKRVRGGMVKQTRGSCWEGYKQLGMKKKGDKMVPNCVKANTGIFVEQEVSKKSKKPGMENYNGSHIKSDIGGKSVSNKSYEDYYKGMI